MEERVASKVNNLYDSLVSQKATWLSCDCQNCRLDSISYVLNRIPPRYIVSGRGLTHFVSKDDTQINADINVLALEGIRLVNAAKRPYHKENTSSYKVEELAKPRFYFPTITGCVFDGITFEPLSNTLVTLKINGKVIPMIDATWQNPCPTFNATKASYAFLAKPQDADKENQHCIFDFCIEVSSNGYSNSSCILSLPLISEVADHTRINSMYTLKMQDIFLYKNDPDFDNDNNFI